MAEAGGTETVVGRHQDEENHKKAGEEPET